MKIARPTFRVSRRRAFSIVEMMIALVVLGLGLLFIAAAIPAGLTYAAQTTELATAEAVADYAFAELEGSLRLARVEPDPRTYTTGDTFPTYNERPRRESIFRPRRAYMNAAAPTPPRFPTTDTYFEVDTTFEPIVKVRPFVMANVGIAPVRGDVVIDYAEINIATYLASEWGIGSLLEADLGIAGGSVNHSLIVNPAVSALARVYPEPRPRTPLRVEDFLNGSNGQSNYRAYTDRDGLTATDFGAFEEERRQVLGRRIAWTAFYRRVGYDNPGPWSPPAPWGFGDSDDRPADAGLYEVLVVVTRRPTENHRFAMQDWDATNANSEPTAVAPGSAGSGLNQLVGADRVAPVPWLVTFTELPELVLNDDFFYSTSGPAALAQRTRVFDNSFTGAQTPTLEFRCSAEVGRLLPAGAIFIPAVNDDWPSNPVIPSPPTPRALFAPRVGFVPNTSDMQIFTVVETTFDGDEAIVLVENKGVYPWVNRGNGFDAQHWPVWVIPPAFEQRVGGDPLFEDRSPVLLTQRRVIRIPEVVE